MNVSIPDETPIDPSHLLPHLQLQWDGSRSSLNLLEAENITEPTVKYLVGPITSADAPFTFDWMFALHREMFGNVWSYAGKARTSNVTIGIEFFHVEAQMWALAEDVSCWKTTPDTLIDDAAEIHHRAVQIHPFLNGNGRWSRMLANIWLRLHGSPPTMWPEGGMAEVGDIRAEYIRAVKAADNRDRRPLAALHRRHTPQPASDH